MAKKNWKNYDDFWEISPGQTQKIYNVWEFMFSGINRAFLTKFWKQHLGSNLKMSFKLSSSIPRKLQAFYSKLFLRVQSSMPAAELENRRSFVLLLDDWRQILVQALGIELAKRF